MHAVTRAVASTAPLSKSKVARAAATAAGPAGDADRKPARRPVPQPLEAASLPDSLLKIQTVAAVTGLSASTIFRKLAADPPQFPEPVRLGLRCTRWRSADVRDWLAAQVVG
jgi:prophage regulatory protein